jgi:flagellar hook-associated protein 2
MLDGISAGSAMDQLMAQYEAVERQPIDVLESKKEFIQKKQNTYKELKTKVKELVDLSQKYQRTGALSEFGDKTVNSTNEKVATASSNAKAIDGSHTLTVTQMAKSDTIISNQITKANSDISSSLGASTQQIRVSVNGNDYDIDIAVTGTETNEQLFEKVANSINGTQDIEINAAIVNDTGTTQRLTLSSKKTGLDNAMTLTDISGSLLSNLGISDSLQSSGSSGGYLYADDELNAKFVLDNINMESSSNTVTDAITGVTLEIKSADPTETLTIGVKTDVDGLKSTVKDFLDKYNDVLDYVNSASFVDKTTYLRGPLASEVPYQNLRATLRSYIVETITGLNSDQPTTLGEIGISGARDGKLSFDDYDKFKEYAEADPQNISDIFNSENGLASKIYDFLTEYSQTGGIIDRSEDTVESKITNINKRIKAYEARIEIKLEGYRKQFAALQEAMIAIQNQQSSLGVVLNSGYSYGGFY